MRFKRNLDLTCKFDTIENNFMHRLVHLLETGRVPIRSCPVLTVVEVEANVISTNKRSKVTN